VPYISLRLCAATANSLVDMSDRCVPVDPASRRAQ